MTDLAELHNKNNSLISLYLYKSQHGPSGSAPSKASKSASEEPKRKEHYTVYGLCPCQEYCAQMQQERVVFVADGSDYDSGCTISKSLLKQYIILDLYFLGLGK